MADKKTDSQGKPVTRAKSAAPAKTPKSPSTKAAKTSKSVVAEPVKAATSSTTNSATASTKIAAAPTKNEVVSAQIEHTGVSAVLADQASTPFTESAAKQGFFTKAKIAVLSVIVVVLIGGGAAAFAFLPAVNSDDKLIFDAFANLAKSNDVIGEGTFAFSDDSLNPGTSDSIGFVLDAYSSGDKQSRFVASLDLANARSLDGLILGSRLVSTEIIYQNGDYYVRLNYPNSLVQQLVGAYIPGAVPNFDGQWIKITQAELDDYIKEFSNQDQTKVQECTNKVADKFRNDTGAQQKLFDAVFSSSKLLSVKNTGDEGDIRSFSLSFTDDKHKIRQTITDLRETGIVQDIADCSGYRDSADEWFDEAIESLDEDIAGAKSDRYDNTGDTPNISFAINTKTRQFDSFDYEINSSSSEISAKIKLKINTRDNLSIETPSSAMSLGEVIAAFTNYLNLERDWDLGLVLE